MDDRTDLFAHYEVDEDMIKMFNDKIDNANGSQMTYRQHKRAGHKLGWVFTNVTIGGRSEKRMVVCWHDDKNNPLDVPTRFPALDIVAPAGPVKAWYVQMSDVLRYHEGGIGGANQKVVFDHESTDPRFAEWQEFVKDVDDVLNKGRCTFLAKNAAEVAGSYLSKNELKYINKHGPEKGAEWLFEHLEDSNNRSQHQCRFWCAKNNIFQARRGEGPVLKICPADREILDMEGFDPSCKIENHLKTCDNDQSLRLLKITLPGTSASGNTVKPNELQLLQKNAVASMKLTIYSLYKRPADDQHSVSCANTGVSMLTNGPFQSGDVPAVDMMATLRAGKRARTESVEQNSVDEI